MINAEDSETGAKLNTEQVAAEALTLLVAGADTTSTTTSWTVLLLHENPKYVGLLREELKTIPKENGQFPHAALKNLPLLNGIIYEGLRLFNVAGGVSREAPLGGLTFEYKGQQIAVPAGTEVVLPFWTLHHDEKLWTRAHDFWPERWNEEENEEGPVGPRPCRRDAFFGFSAGTRDCIGKNFAWQEARVMLAHFVDAFDFELAPGCDPQPREQFIIAPGDGKIDLIVRKRV